MCLTINIPLLLSKEKPGGGGNPDVGGARGPRTRAAGVRLLLRPHPPWRAAFSYLAAMGVTSQRTYIF